ncbi:MAG: hypothetical protein HYZ53_15920 [Planctomycetes bacterium]|nr:hypothetical protein [Planctomycetota bacterium]
MIPPEPAEQGGVDGSATRPVAHGAPALWAVGVAGLYVATLALLTCPMALACFFDEVYPRVPSLLEVYAAWQYWALVGGLGLLECIALLLVPVPLTRGRPVTRGRWIGLAHVASFLMALLVASGVMAATEAIRQEMLGGDGGIWAALALGLGGWAFWLVVFLRYRKAGEPASALRRVVDRLLAGSVAELLVAVPCHVWVRHRNFCCAGAGTFLGISTGLSVLLFAFGPGVFFLFAERAAARAGAEKPASSAVGAGLRALSDGFAALGGHGKDAVLWTGTALLVAVLWPLWSLIGWRGVDELPAAGRLVFMVLCGVACVHAVRGWQAGESRRLWVGVGAAFLGEAALLTALWLAVEH